MVNRVLGRLTGSGHFARKNLFDAARVQEVKQRIALLRLDSQRQSGKRNAPRATDAGGA
jgi:hypothetical protein